MPIIVELVSATDTLAFYPTPDVNGWVYDNATLDRWYAMPDIDAKRTKRPNAHGNYPMGQVFSAAAEPILVGQHYAENTTDALRARRRLAAFYNDGNMVTMRVTDELGTVSREVQMLGLFAPFRYGFDWFPFDAQFEAPDPRRYAATQVVGPIPMPSGGTGLQWNLGTLPNYFDWGTAGEIGQGTATNTGSMSTSPRILVGGAGEFGLGFYITELETGRELRFERATAFGEVVVFDSRTQRAKINDSDVTGALTRRQWFTIPPGATRRYQITPLGSVSGTPTMTIYAAPADL